MQVLLAKHEVTSIDLKCCDRHAEIQKYRVSYWRGCLIIHVSVELAGSYLEHVPCKFWKVCLGLKYLPQINYGGKLTCLDVVHASVITDVLRDGLAVHCFRAALCAAVIWMLL